MYHVSVCAREHVCMHRCTLVLTYTCVCARVSVFVCVCGSCDRVYGCVRARVSVHVNVVMCVCVCVCVWVCVHGYTLVQYRS